MSASRRSVRRRALVTPIAVTSAVATAAAWSCGIDVTGTYVPPEAGADTAAVVVEAPDDGGSLPLLDAETNADAAVALEAGPAPGFCATQAPGSFVYCNDFEDGTVGFTSTRTDAGTVTVQANVDRTTNRALRVVLPRGTGSRSVYASQTLIPVEAISATGYDVSFVFSLRKSELAYAVLGGPFRTTDPGAAAGSALGVAAYSDGVRYDYALPTADLVSVFWLPGPTWHTARIRYGTALGGTFVQVLVDGVWVALDRPPRDATLDTLDLRLGAYFTSEDDGSTEVLFDDVLVRTF